MLFWVAIALLPTLVSLIYYGVSKNDSSFYRISVSAHGFVTSALCIAAIIVWGFGQPSPEYARPFSFSLFFPCFLIAFSLWRFVGNRWIHLLQAINVVWLMAALIVGSMMISGNWI